MRLLAFVLVVSLIPVGALAQDAIPASDTASADARKPLSSSTQSGSMPERKFVFSLLMGGQVQPDYFGSRDMELRPAFRPNFLLLSLGEHTRFGGKTDFNDDDPLDRPLGFTVGASFNYISSRKSSDHSELFGLQDVDGSVEIGGAVGYVWPNAETFATLRYGVTGHKSFVGEVGAFWVTRPAKKLVFRVGPRLEFGSDGFADTYFGVTPAEAAASQFNAYNPDGGLYSAGLDMIATYQLNKRWWLEGRLRWQKLVDDAADSPIVLAGDDDVVIFTLGVRRTFTINF